jgi:hypothetical protein
MAVMVRPMTFSLFGSRAVLPAGWSKQTTVTVLGGSRTDVGDAPGPDARITAVALLGGVDVTVPDNARVVLRGFSLVGGRRVVVRPDANGPIITVTAYTLLGGANVTNRSERQ